MRNSSALIALLAASGSVFAGGFAAPIASQITTLAPPVVVPLTPEPQPVVTPPAEASQPVVDTDPAVVAQPAAAVSGVRIVVDQQTGQRRLELPQSILFPVADASLNADYDAMLAQVVAVLNATPGAKLGVVGNTDSTAPESYNLGLSVERANVVARALVAKGLDPSRLVVSGAGESKPVADNATEAGRTANRRTELVLINP